jgi:uncharacterized RDD family membrane protein YckC
MAVEPAGIDLDRETAGFGQRAAAWAIDILVVLALTTPLSLPWLAEVMSAVMAADVDLLLDLLFPYDLPWWPLVEGFAVACGYAIFMLGRYGRTLGMMVLGLRVTNPDGRRIGWGKAALRTAVYVVPNAAAAALYNQSELAYSLVSRLQTIGLLWIMVDGAHQGYHDKIARTLVMRKRLRVLDSDGAPRAIQ